MLRKSFALILIFGAVYSFGQSGNSVELFKQKIDSVVSLHKITKGEAYLLGNRTNIEFLNPFKIEGKFLVINKTVIDLEYLLFFKVSERLIPNREKYIEFHFRSH